MRLRDAGARFMPFSGGTVKPSLSSEPDGDGETRGPSPQPTSYGSSASAENASERCLRVSPARASAAARVSPSCMASRTSK